MKTMRLGVVLVAASVLLGGFATSAGADHNPNDPDYWESRTEHPSTCYYHEADGGSHGGLADNGKAVKLKAFQPSWGTHWELLVVKGGSIDVGYGRGNAVYGHPSAGVNYYPPSNGGGQRPSVSHWIVCKGTVPPTTTTPPTTVPPTTVPPTTAPTTVPPTTVPPTTVPPTTIPPTTIPPTTAPPTTAPPTTVIETTVPPTTIVETTAPTTTVAVTTTAPTTTIVTPSTLNTVVESSTTVVPTTAGPTTAPSSAPSTTTGGSLPRTGGNHDAALLIGAVAFVGGVAMLLARRRPRSV